MVTLSPGAFVLRSRLIVEDADRLSPQQVNQRLEQAGLAPLADAAITQEKAKTGTLAYGILAGHNQTDDMRQLQLRFDSLASHDITYVGIIQSARIGGLEQFPVPYVLTNCHNSLCAVGGTINADDQLFGLSAARKYGGIFVPAHIAVIHQYLREQMAGSGRMILASDSHTRYGALGTMGIGEGGPELVKQILGKTYELPYPEVIAVYLEGKPANGVGPQDVALAIIREVFPNGFVKNKVMEFIGPGIASLPIDFRNGIDVMTTESACLSSIWETDAETEGWYKVHGRAGDYKPMAAGEVCWYDGIVRVDLSRVEPMIALPFHPSNAWPIAEVNRRGAEILKEVEAAGKRQIENPALSLKLTEKLVGGRLRVDQGSVAGCAGGTFDNVMAVAQTLKGKTTGNGAFALSVYPASQPIYLELVRNGTLETLIAAGAVIRTSFCGPCFGSTDTPGNDALSIRHSTRNFPNREGSKPTNGQLAAVALMDARSIAATAVHGGLLTPATDLNLPDPRTAYRFDATVYAHRVYQGFGNPQRAEALRFGPNIADWPAMPSLPENLLLQVASVIRDPVTTTDELIPSGETSSYRSNPMKLAEFALSRKDPGYVGRAKDVQAMETSRREFVEGRTTADSLREALASFWTAARPAGESFDPWLKQTGLASVVFAIKPGDGSAREQAASCQKVLGGQANIAVEYATKRYRSNLINWGMLPFTIAPAAAETLALGDCVYIPGIRKAVADGAETIPAVLVQGGKSLAIELKLEGLSQEDRKILLAGCLLNYYAQ